MTDSPDDPVEALFYQAVELPAQERAAFLDIACRGDLALRAEVESLLACDERTLASDALLKSPLVRMPENATSSDGWGSAVAEAELPGQIGRYRANFRFTVTTCACNPSWYYEDWLILVVNGQVPSDGSTGHLTATAAAWASSRYRFAIFPS